MTVASTFTPVGALNISVGPTPLAVQVTGTTCVITNIGAATVYGSMGGSGASAVSISTISGAPVGSATFPNAANGSGGVAIAPLASSINTVALVIPGGSAFLWLQTVAGVGVVNVACGA